MRKSIIILAALGAAACNPSNPYAWLLYFNAVGDADYTEESSCSTTFTEIGCPEGEVIEDDSDYDYMSEQFGTNEEYILELRWGPALKDGVNRCLLIKEGNTFDCFWTEDEDDKDILHVNAGRLAESQSSESYDHREETYTWSDSRTQNLRVQYNLTINTGLQTLSGSRLMIGDGEATRSETDEWEDENVFGFGWSNFCPLDGFCENFRDSDDCEGDTCTITTTSSFSESSSLSGYYFIDVPQGFTTEFGGQSSGSAEW